MSFSGWRAKSIILQTTWMYFKGIMLIEGSQSPNVTYRVSPFAQHSWHKTTIEMEVRLQLPGLAMGGGTSEGAFGAGAVLHLHWEWYKIKMHKRMHITNRSGQALWMIPMPISVLDVLHLFKMLPLGEIKWMVHGTSLYIFVQLAVSL